MSRSRVVWDPMAYIFPHADPVKTENPQSADRLRLSRLQRRKAVADKGEHRESLSEEENEDEHKAVDSTEHHSP